MLAVAHPRASTSSYLFSQFLANARLEFFPRKSIFLSVLVCARKKENRQPKGGMGGRHVATTQGF